MGVHKETGKTSTLPLFSLCFLVWWSDFQCAFPALHCSSPAVTLLFRHFLSQPALVAKCYLTAS